MITLSEDSKLDTGKQAGCRWLPPASCGNVRIRYKNVSRAISGPSLALGSDQLHHAFISPQGKLLKFNKWRDSRSKDWEVILPF